MKVILMLILATMLWGKLPYNKNAYHRTMNVHTDNRIVSKTLKDLKHLNRPQKELLVKLYKACADFDMSNTCVAISYKESKLGKYLFNDVTGDYGVMGINLKTFQNSHDMKSSYWGDRELASRLIIGTDFNIAAAIENLRGWSKIYPKKWKLVWGSYNGGWKPNSQYATVILSYVKAFKTYIKNDKWISIELHKD